MSDLFADIETGGLNTLGASRIEGPLVVVAQGPRRGI
jgi:hypothetical protein